jgi:hypothetical protein
MEKTIWIWTTRVPARSGGNNSSKRYVYEFEGA